MVGLQNYSDEMYTHLDVLLLCRVELLEQNYFHAVLEAAKSAADKLRDMSGLDAGGSALVDAACALSASLSTP
jgi:uncharacterized protein (TIGR02391 family)